MSGAKSLRPCSAWIKLAQELAATKRRAAAETNLPKRSSRTWGAFVVGAGDVRVRLGVGGDVGLGSTVRFFAAQKDAASNRLPEDG